MQRHKESHLDHGLSPGQIDYLFSRFADRREFFKETIELPPELGTAPCALWGPAMGDPEILNGSEVIPLPSGEYILPSGLTFDTGRHGTVDIPTFTGAITLAKRGARTWDSRLIDLPCRPTRKVFVVAGPHEEHACILYTAYAGAEAPQEPTDPKLPEVKRAASIAFWIKHALSRHAS